MIRILGVIDKLKMLLSDIYGVAWDHFDLVRHVDFGIQKISQSMLYQESAHLGHTAIATSKISILGLSHTAYVTHFADASLLLL